MLFACLEDESHFILFSNDRDETEVSLDSLNFFYIDSSFTSTIDKHLKTSDPIFSLLLIEKPNDEIFIC